MKPFPLILLLILILGGITFSQVKDNKSHNDLVVTEKTVAQPVSPIVAVQAPEVKSAYDTGWVSVSVSWNGADCSFATVDLVYEITGPPVYRKIINTLGGCTTAAVFSGIPAGTALMARVKENTGREAYSSFGYVHGGWPPLILFVSF